MLLGSELFLENWFFCFLEEVTFPSTQHVANGVGYALKPDFCYGTPRRPKYFFFLFLLTKKTFFLWVSAALYVS